MSKLTTSAGQTVYNVAIQGMGSIEGLFSMLRDNELTLEDPTPGTILEIRDPSGWSREEFRSAVVEEISSRRLKIRNSYPSSLPSVDVDGFNYELNFELNA